MNGKTFVDLSDNDLKELFSLFRSCTRNYCKPETTTSTSLCKPCIKANLTTLNVQVCMMFVSKQGYVHLCISHIRLFPVQYNKLGLAKTRWTISRFQIGFLQLLWSVWTKGEITDSQRCEIINAVCVPWYQVCSYLSKEEY